MATVSVPVRILCDNKELMLQNDFPASLLGPGGIANPAAQQLFTQAMIPFIRQHQKEALEASKKECSAGCKRKTTTVNMTPMSVSSRQAFSIREWVPLWEWEQVIDRPNSICTSLKNQWSTLSPPRTAATSSAIFSFVRRSHRSCRRWPVWLGRRLSLVRPRWTPSRRITAVSVAAAVTLCSVDVAKRWGTVAR